MNDIFLGSILLEAFTPERIETKIVFVLTSGRSFLGVAYPEEPLRPRVIVVLRIHLLHQVALLGMLGCILLQQHNLSK